MLRYFSSEPSFKLRWCRAQDLSGSQIPVTTGGFELRTSCIRSNYLSSYLLLTKQVRSSNPPVVTGIRNPNKSRAQHRRSLKLGSKLNYLNIKDIVLAKVYKKLAKELKNHQNISYLLMFIIKDLTLFILISFCMEMTS